MSVGDDSLSYPAGISTLTASPASRYQLGDARREEIVIGSFIAPCAPSVVPRLVTKTDSRLARRQNDVVIRIDSLRDLERLLDRNRHDMRRLERHHVAPLGIRDRSNGRTAETSR